MKNSKSGDYAKMPYKPGTGTAKTMPFTPRPGGGTKTMPYRPKKVPGSIGSGVGLDTRDVFEKALETNNPLRKALFPKPRGG